MNYYNDADADCCAWLRNLMAGGEIPAGDVDHRSIADVKPADLAGYTQCHFFAGIGGWPLALRLACWPAERPVWTGSCPCQPFSVAGKRRGQADERHLWPVWFRLIRECRPQCVVGEQVAGAIGHGWLDGVCADLEGEGYAVGAVVLGAHSVGAPHRRQRLWWAATLGVPDQSGCGPGWSTAAPVGYGSPAESAGRMGHAQRTGLSGRTSVAGDDGAQRPAAERAGGDAGGMDYAADSRCPGERPSGEIEAARDGARLQEPSGRSAPAGDGHWRDTILLPCADGKARRVPVPESGIQPLAYGLPRSMAVLSPELRKLARLAGIDGKSLKAAKAARRVGLKGAGNAIVPQVAAEFVAAFLEEEDDHD